MKFFKSLKEQKTPKIKFLIHQRLAKTEPPRPHNPLHASDLMGELEFCPREHALLDLKQGAKKGKFIGTAQRITFDHGRDMEYRLRNEWLRDIAVGHWQCGVCSHVLPFGKAPKIKCPSCGYGHQWKYKEAIFKSPVSGIMGSLDVLLDVGAAKLRVVEVKSIDKDMFKDLKAPLAEHRFRTSLYLHLAEECPSTESLSVQYNEAHILYVSKSFGFKDESLKEAGIVDAPFSPIKEFVVQRDDKLIETSLNKATVLHRWRTDPAVGMPCQICHNGLTARAQKCPTMVSCFSGKFPPILTWLENGVPRHPNHHL